MASSSNTGGRSVSFRRAGLYLFVPSLVLLVGAVFYRVFPSRPDNVLLITLDTTRADRLGCYGYSPALTPNLDRLAAQGVTFELAYAPVPLTLPSHASLLTGLYPPEHGLRVNGQGALPSGVSTLATELQAAGYETGAFIAAAVVLERKFGLARGFRTYDDDESGSIDGLEGHHRYRPATATIDRALAWLRPRSQKPFLCWIHLYDPHFPYLAHEDQFGSRFVDQPYDGDIAYVDASLKRVFDALDSWHISDRTMVVVVGDHGECLHEHGERAHGMTVYDAALKVPLLIRTPRESRPGHRVHGPVSLVDLCPTVLDCLGRKPMSGISGRSLRKALRGEQLPDTPIYAETDEPYHEAHCAPLRALISSPWKYIRSPIPELYNLQRDPNELRNLESEHPAVREKLERQLAEWEQGMQRRIADNVSMSDQDRRALNSLGYTGRSADGDFDIRSQDRDVKTLLPSFNQLKDADALMESGQYDLAEPLLRKILAADEFYFNAHGSLGRCLLKLDRTPEAIASFQRSLELNPSDDRLRTMLGVALFVTGDYEAAAAESEIALRTNEELIEARYNLGLSLEKLGRVDEAIQQYELCIEQIPHFVPAQQRLEYLRNQSADR